MKGMKLRARDSVYWLQMNHDIETLIKTCGKCQEFSKRNNKDPDIPREIPLVPWSLLEMDLFSMDDSTFLLVSRCYIQMSSGQDSHK